MVDDFHQPSTMLCLKRPSNCVSISFLNRLTPIAVIICCLLGGCASSLKQSATAYYHTAHTFTEQHPLPPAFLIKNHEETFNRIGTPRAIGKKSEAPDIVVDPLQHTIFFEEISFTAARGSYRNLVYRIHFSEVPFSLVRVNLTAGNNPGILLIYTIDSDNKLLLVTTVHTCGCFLAFFPTDNMDKAMYPPDWPQESQWVYGYTLPARIPLQGMEQNGNLIFSLESESHRISDVSFTPSPSAVLENTVTMEMSPMSSLYHLPYNDGFVSFFEESGPRAGYVKNNTKPLERMLISWWAFDLYVGEDKAYGKDDTSNTMFYTSLKFWHREASNLKDFPRFLNFWGWQF